MGGQTTPTLLNDVILGLLAPTAIGFQIPTAHRARAGAFFRLRTGLRKRVIRVYVSFIPIIQRLPRLAYFVDGFRD